QISIRRQCELIGLNRASYYYQPAQESELNLKLMRLIDEQYLKTPFYGWPRMTVYLKQLGYQVNPKRVRRLMQLMPATARWVAKRNGIKDFNPSRVAEVPVTTLYAGEILDAAQLPIAHVAFTPCWRRSSSPFWTTNGTGPLAWT
ncbi:hypothetical protein B4Q13_20745, partial [Lacticaseibacillus rhamnosus]